MKSNFWRVGLPSLVLAVLLGAAFIFVLGPKFPQNGPLGPETPTDPPITAQSTKTITMGTFLKALGNTPYHVSKNKKWFEEEPDLKDTQIVYLEFTDRPMISNAFTSNELQVLFSAEIPAILTRAQGNDVRIVAVSGVAAQEILVQTDSPINKAEDLRGQSLAVLASTSSHYGLLKILTSHGMTEKDVDLRFMGPDLARVAFEKKELTAWAVWAPWVEQQEVSGRGRTLPRGDAAINSVMTVSAPLLTDDPRRARAIHRIIQRAKKWIVENPDEAKVIASAELELPKDVVDQAWPKFNWLAELDDQTIVDIQEKATFLATQDKTRKGRELDVRKELVELSLKNSKP